MKIKRLHWLLLVLGALAVTFIVKPRIAVSLYQRLRGRKTVAEQLAVYGPSARARLQAHLETAGVVYPPARLMLVAFKQERRLEVYAAPAGGAWRFVRAYPIQAASGGPGPKLKEGDQQVPEGLYAIESLNPNSLFHLALRIAYPNAFDRAQAAREGRTNLGGDIMIHGRGGSIGCLDVGDEAIEELFVLAAETGLPDIRVVIAPVDFRTDRKVPSNPALPPWVPTLDEEIRAQLETLPAPPTPPN